MKIEIDLDEFQLKLKHAIGRGIAEDVVRRELVKIVERHRQELLKEFEEFLSKFVIAIHREHDRAVTKIVISTPDEIPEKENGPS